MNLSKPKRKYPESLKSWLECHPLIASLYGMHTRIEKQHHLEDAAMVQLIEGAYHSNPKVRWWCAHKMDHLADKRSIDALLSLAQDPVPKVRAEAVHSLGCDRCKQSALGVDTIALMIDFALNDPEDRVRGAAIFALGYLPADSRAAEALQKIIDDKSNSEGVRENAQRRLKYHTASQ